jgi:uncharacterized protein DUF4398
MRVGGTLLLCLALAAGCASHPAPTEKLRDSYAAVALAVDAGAADYAPRELALAREKMVLAERLIARGAYETARWALEQARVDAELAAVKAASARARQAAAERPR